MTVWDNDTQKSTSLYRRICCLAFLGLGTVSTTQSRQIWLQSPPCNQFR